LQIGTVKIIFRLIDEKAGGKTVIQWMIGFS